MRRDEREIRDRARIEAIIEKALVCRLALSDGGEPYVVPLNFGYRDGVLYIHSAPRGRKINIVRRNPHVCFEMDTDHEVVRSTVPCDWTMRYRSVIGFGTASLVEDRVEKREALTIIGEHYTNSPFEITDDTIRDVAVIKVAVEEMTGKSSGY